MGPEAAGRILGYARVSTKGQDLAYQLQKLKAAGCVRIYREKRSGKNTQDRPELKRLLGSLAKDDLVLATATDRVARDPVDLLSILQTVKASGASLRLLDEPFIDTTSEISELIVFLVGWAARWQRQRIIENTRHGRMRAIKNGTVFGRKPKLNVTQKNEIKRLRALGMSGYQISTKFAVSPSTIYRAFAIGEEAASVSIAL